VREHLSTTPGVEGGYESRGPAGGRLVRIKRDFARRRIHPYIEDGAFDEAQEQQLNRQFQTSESRRQSLRSGFDVGPTWTIVKPKTRAKRVRRKPLVGASVQPAPQHRLM
jgi:hypothetical protein